MCQDSDAPCSLAGHSAAAAAAIPETLPAVEGCHTLPYMSASQMTLTIVECHLSQHHKISIKPLTPDLSDTRISVFLLLNCVTELNNDALGGPG